MVAAEAPPQPPHPAAVVGNLFVKNYYQTLLRAPQKLHKLYKAQSIFSHSTETECITAEGSGDIKDAIMTSVGNIDERACRVDIKSIDPQESVNGGIIVLVTGMLVYSNGQDSRYFTQAVFLDRQTDPCEGYYVLNDIVRFLPSLPGVGVVEVVSSKWSKLSSKAVEQQVSQHEVEEVEAEEEEEEEEEEAVYEEREVQQQAPAEPAVESKAWGEEEEEVEEEQVAVETPAPVAPPPVDLRKGEDIDDIAPPEPKTWAEKMAAAKLKAGGTGKWTESKVKGFVLPPGAAAAPKAAAPKATAATPSAAPIAPASASTETSGKVRLWLSKLPTEGNVGTEEVVSALNNAFAVAGWPSGRVVEVKWRDTSKDWGYVTVYNQEAADTAVQLSKDKKFSLQGKILKVEPEKITPEADGGKGKKGKGGGKNTGGKSSEKAPADGEVGGKNRKSGKGGGGEKGGKGSRGSGYKGGEKGGGAVATPA